MNDKDQIKDLFSKKLGNYEAKVNPDLWANVASQVGAASSGTAAGGMSLFTKAIIGISGAAVLTTGVVLYNQSQEESSSPKEQAVITQSNDPVKEEVSKDITEPKVETSSNETNHVAIVEPEPPKEVRTVPTTGPWDGKAGQGVPNMDFEVPEPPRDMPSSTEAYNEKSVTEVQEERKKDVIALSQEQNIASEDEPTTAEENNEENVTIEVVLPNVFTPNGDGWNDTYHIISSNVSFANFEFVVYDRRGNIVMISKDPNFKWTAIDPQTGLYLEKNVYAYVLIGETIEGKSFKKSGTITIE